MPMFNDPVKTGPQPLPDRHEPAVAEKIDRIKYRDGGGRVRYRDKFRCPTCGREFIRIPDTRDSTSGYVLRCHGRATLRVFYDRSRRNRP